MNTKRLYLKLIVLSMTSLSFISCASDDDSSEYNTTYPKLETKSNQDAEITSTEEAGTFSKEKERPTADKPTSCYGWNCVQFND